LANLKAGDEVVTSGGIIGRVKSVADNFVTIDAGSTSLKIMKSHVSGLTKPKEAPAQK
jgi:preprotein translocase subunit YajC